MDSRQQIYSFIDSQITDPTNQQNTAAVMRAVLKYIVQNAANLADDELGVNPNPDPTGFEWDTKPSLSIEGETVSVSVGLAGLNGEPVFFDAASFPVALPSEGNTRIDAVFARSNGTYGYTFGTEGDHGVTPKIPDGTLLVGYTIWTATGGDITEPPIGLTLEQVQELLGDYYTKEELDVMLAQKAILKTHAELLNLMVTGGLSPGAFYVYEYTCTYVLPGTSEVVRKTGTPEMLIVQAATPSALTGKAISASFPNDYIELDIAYTENAATGKIVKRRDVQGIQTNDDWRNITYRRYRTSGIHHHPTTKAGAGYASTIVYGDVLDTRYAEYYIKFDDLANPANPVLTLTKGGVTRSFELVRPDGSSIAANTFSSLFPGGFALVYYSVELGKYVGFTSQWENTLATGRYMALTGQDFTAGNGTRILVNGSDYAEFYTFKNSRTPVGKDVVIESQWLANIVLNPSGPMEGVYFGARSYDATVICSELANFRFSSGFRTNYFYSSLHFTSFNFDAHENYGNLVLTDRHTYIRGETFVPASYIQFRGVSIIARRTSLNLPHGVMLLMAMRLRDSTIRLHFGAFSIRADEITGTYWNNNLHAEKSNFASVINKAFEYGSERNNYTSIGDISTNYASYRDVRSNRTDINGVEFTTGGEVDPNALSFSTDTFEI